MATLLPRLTPTAATDRQQALQAGIQVEILTCGWMILEAAVALVAGWAAHSLLLTAFGLDSVIELVTGGALLWRLTVEAHAGTTARVAWAERRATWITGGSLVGLCVYVALSAGAGLVLHQQAETSWLGISLALAALGIMPLLAWRKRQIAAQIDSAALRGDAACSITCAYMSATMLVGLGLTALGGWWWADSLAALALLVWLVPEARHALAAARAGRSGCCAAD